MSGVRRKAIVFGVVAAWGMTACALAADWPQFLGPQRDGIAHDAKGLARAWPENGPRVVWEAPAGPGYGGAAIYGDSVFLLDRVGEKGDVLRRIRFSDGKEIWRFAYDAPGKLDHDGSRSTPATDGNLVFAIGPFGQIVAVNFSDGNLVWKGNLLQDWDVKLPQWGIATSPLLYGDWVIMMPWGKKGALVAFEKSTGKVVWTTPNPKAVEPDYQSPVPMTLGGREMILAAGAQDYLIGVDARTGERLWECDGFAKKGLSCPSPVPIGDGRIFMTSGFYSQGSAMVRVERQGEEYKVTQLWKNNDMGVKCGQALLYDGHLYGNSSTWSAHPGGGLCCLALDGELKWDSKASRKRDFDLGNSIIADGLIYVVDGRDGKLFMAEATPEGYNELGAAAILSEPEPWAPLSFKDGKLILRDQHKLVCLDVTAGK